MDDRERLRLASEHLGAAEYDVVRELLEAAAPLPSAVPNPIIESALSICEACCECHAASEWHSDLAAQESRREATLRYELRLLLDMALEHDAARLIGGAPSPDVAGAPPTPERTLLPARRRSWRNVLRRLSFRTRVTDRSSRRSPTGREGEDDPLGPPDAPPACDAAVAGSDCPGAVMPTLRVTCLGAFRVWRDEVLVNDWPNGKGKSIFKYLVTHRAHPVPKEVLMELFWPRADPQRARNNLNVALYRVRQALGQGSPACSYVLYQDECYRLNPDVVITVDAEEFQRHVSDARALARTGRGADAMVHLQAAASLYKGPFIEEDRYDEWPVASRQALERDHREVLERMSEFQFDDGAYDGCILTCQKMLAADACDEGAHRQIMRCYCRQGRRGLALRQYEICAEALKGEFEVSPNQYTTDLYDAIRRNEAV